MLVSDVSASVRFYRDVLGFRLVMADAPAEGPPGWALLRRGETDLLLEARDRWPAHVIPLGGSAPLTFHVPVADAPAVRAALPAGLLCADHAGGAFTLADPDGVLVTCGPASATGGPARRAS